MPDALHSNSQRGRQVTADISGVRPGPVTVSASAQTLTVRWPDDVCRMWTAEFSWDSERPLITMIAFEAAPIVRNAWPQYRATTGNAAVPPGSTNSSIFPAISPTDHS